MQQYYQVNIFNEFGRFKSQELSVMLKKGRNHFFIYFPRFVLLGEITQFSKFCQRYSEIRFCIHDKNLISLDNERFIGRNMSFYLMLKRRGIKIESISYHLGGIYGYGKEIQGHLIKNLIDLEIYSDQVKTRFLRSLFTQEDYIKHLELSLGYLKSIVKIAHQEDIYIVIKNLCTDYCLADLKKESYFSLLGYKVSPLPLNEEIGQVPVLLEKGDFPRHVKEITQIEKETEAGLALDMEFLRYTLILSKRYNMQNSAMMDLWGIKLTPRNKEMLERYGFLIEKGKPIFFEKELDLYNLIFHLKGKVEIAHISGSVGPVFVDKKFLSEQEITTDLLIGILNKEDIPFATVGKEQLSALDGYDDMMKRRNFKYESSEKIWEKIFKKQFLEDVYLLKEIGCKKIVQKMKFFSENATQTFETYNEITEINIEEKGKVL